MYSMKKWLYGIGFLVFFLPYFSVFAADEYFIGKVESVQKAEDEFFGEKEFLKVRLSNGDRTEVEAGDIFPESASKGFEPGNKIIVRRTEDGQYGFMERYRLTGMGTLFMIFFIGTGIIAGRRGIFALFGLATSAAVLFLFLFPALAKGQNPLVFGGISVVLIGISSILLAQGFRKNTVLAIAGTLGTIGFAFLFGEFAVRSAELFGLGSEQTLQVFLAGIGNGNFRGILLVGILLGALGLLDDITNGQVAAVSEIAQANPNLSRRELFVRASNVGRAHLLSLINTLFLAYAGVSLPLLLLFSTGETPVWVLLNSEMIAEEIVRTLVGSMALFLAIPFTTGISAFFLGKK